MKAPSRRFKNESELTTGEHFERVGARLRGEVSPPQFETDEFREHRIKVLRSGGLDDEADVLEGRPADPATWSVQDHFEAQRREP